MLSNSRKYINSASLALTIALLTVGCTEDTGNMGIFPVEDGVSTSVAIYDVTSKSLSMGSIIADNSNGYLGVVVDSETGDTIKAECAAQFYCLEDYTMPPKEVMLGDITVDAQGNKTAKRGVVKCDSCEIRIYLSSFFGEKNNPMKLEVYELSKTNILEETEKYYADVDLTKYIGSTTPIATKVFTPNDYSVDETTSSGSGYINNIRILLPTSIGQKILEAYYENPKNFENSYKFIRNVCPGFYFKISNGEGTMLKTMVDVFNIYYNYGDKNDASIINEGVTRFSATPEVIQSTRFSNSNLTNLINETGHTYLKTPAGICTEMTLPIDDVFKGHESDSISLAEITLTRYNKSQTNNQFGTPKNLLLVRKAEMQSFFENNEITNNRTNYICTFNSTYNTYTYSNICRLLSYCYNEKKEGAKKEGITEEQWIKNHPDWDKVVLIPVVTSSNTSGNLTSVSHDMSLNSVKLIGGDTKLKMQVVYSRFNKE